MVTDLRAMIPTGHHALVTSESADGLQATDLSPVGGVVAGLLFDNPRIGLAPQFTWTFTFACHDIRRSYGDSPVSVTLDWVPLPRCDWRNMVGLEASASQFAEPIESSVYFFKHHRFDTATVMVTGQDHERLRVLANIAGDIDGLGIDHAELDAWLTIDRIMVTLSDRPESAAAAEAVLASFTSTAGLVGSGQGGRYVFVPSACRPS